MAGITILDPLLSPAEGDAMVSLWRDYGSYGQYSNESQRAEFAPELAQRYDAATNFVRTGGRFGRTGEAKSVLAARTNYFRETYAYGDEITAPDIADRLFNHPGLLDAARKLHDRSVIVPAILYANILLPGQELAVHTDVPEFRGANRKVLPQWLLVVMHHSGLFESWRMPIATGICYFGAGGGGELAYYPDGPAGGPATYKPKHNTAVLLDTDSVFHGVDRVAGDDSDLTSLRPGMRIHPEADETWTVRDRDGRTVVSRHSHDELRYSVSWKGYCFTDEAERDAWSGHQDDLSLDQVLDYLIDDLCQRGRLESPADRPDDAALGKLLIEEYVRFPAPAAAPASD